MRRRSPAPRPNPGDGCAVIARAAIGASAIVAAAVLFGANTVGAAPARQPGAVPGGPPPTTVQVPDPAADLDVEIARLRREADALSEEYFDALAHLFQTERRIGEIEARVPVLAAEVEELQRRTRQRAVLAYKRAGNDLGTIIGATDALVAARQVQWLDRLNARDTAMTTRLRDLSARLEAQRAELRTARASASAALEDVRRRGATIDGLLVDAEARRQAALTPPPTAATEPDPTTVAGPTPLPPSTPPPAPPTDPPADPPVAPPAYQPTPGVHPRHDEPFLVCTRTREASGNYRAYNPAGPYMGAYQFLQSTWNSAANHAGRADLIGVPPHTASPFDQDDLAWALYQWQGARPWGGHCTA